MKRFFGICLLLCALSACITPGGGISSLPASPAAAADQTVLDEQAMLAVELAYKAARTAAELAVDSGVLKGEAAARVAELDNTAFRAVALVRAAYGAGNAASYGAALTEARAAVGALLALTAKE